MDPVFKKNKKNNKKIKNQKRRKRGEREKQIERENNFFIYFSSLTSLFDIRKSDRRNSSGQEAK